MNVLDEVLITSRTGFRTDTAARLLTEVCQRRTFDVAEVRDGDNHIVVRIHILRVELGSHLHDLRLALVAVFLFDLDELCIDHVVTHLFAGEQFVQMCDQFLDLLIFSLQFVDTQAGEGTQTHIYDRFGLQVIEIESLLEIQLSVCRSTACADDLNHLVDVINGDDQAFQDMCFLLGFLQLEARTAGYHLHTVLDEVTQQLLEVQQHRTTFHKGDVVHRKT